MKTLLKLSTIIVTALLMQGGCSTVQQYATPSNAQTATALICSGILASAVNPADRVGIANEIYSVAHAVRTLSGGHVPTQAEMQATIANFTPNGAKWSNIGTAIAGVWGGVYPQVQGNPKLALQYLEAIATGAEDAAAAYAVHPTGTPITP
jgi:hypothetical protein